MTSNRTICCFLFRINLISLGFYSNIHFCNQDSLKPGCFCVLCKVELPSRAPDVDSFICLHICARKNPNQTTLERMLF